MYSKFLLKKFTREYKHLRPEVQATLNIHLPRLDHEIDTLVYDLFSEININVSQGDMFGNCFSLETVCYKS